MFSFHKPKVYRSSAGCCICKAKSSSSRFTDSKKYEEDFMECFRLPERRSGEICNACVLLVKRWKKLPPDSERNWRHVVDARAGPGTKSLTKFKAKNKKKKLKEGSKKLESIKKKHVYIKSADRERSPATFSDGEDMDENGFSGPPSLAPSPTPSEDGDIAIPTVKKRRNRSRSPQHKSSLKHRSSPPISEFLDMKIWKRRKICCGIIFQGPNGEIVKDPRFFKPCHQTMRLKQEESQVVVEEVVLQDQEVAIDIVEHKPVIEEPQPVREQVELLPPQPLPITVLAAASPVGSPRQSPHRSPIPSLPAPQPLTSVKVIAVANAVASNPAKSFSDSSSDSGYDESSNQGVQENGAATPTHDPVGDFPKRCHLQPVEGKID